MSNKDYWSSFLITILPFVILCYVSCSNGPREVTNKNFLADCLYQTNHYRRMHGVPSMTMDKEALELARSKAIQMSKSVADLGPDSNYTLNWSFISGAIIPNCKSLVAQWYKRNYMYNFSLGNVTGKTEPFARMIWKGSTKLGCSQVINDAPWATGVFTVCVYSPKGDLRRNSVENIRPLSSPPNYYNYFLP